MLAFLKAGLVIALNNGNKLHKLCAHLITQKTIDIKRLCGIASMQCGQNIEVNSMLFQYGNSLHYSIKAWLAALINTINIMQLTWAV
mgnify:CR=1 FL=1